MGPSAFFRDGLATGFSKKEKRNRKASFMMGQSKKTKDGSSALFRGGLETGFSKKEKIGGLPF